MSNRYQSDLTSTDERPDEPAQQAQLNHTGEDMVIDVQPKVEEELTTHYRLQLTVAGAVMGLLLAMARWSGANVQPSLQPATAHP